MTCPTTCPLALTKKVSGMPVAPQRRGGSVRRVAYVEVGDLELAHEGARVPGDVLLVDPEEEDASVPLTPPAPLEQRRLLPAGNTPGGPVVQHDWRTVQLLDVNPAVGERRSERSRQPMPELTTLEDGKA